MRVLLVKEVDAALRAVSAAEHCQTMGLIWEVLPGRSAQLNALAVMLARAVLVRWPVWTRQSLPGIQGHWRKQAERACAAGRLPLLRRQALSWQLQQLTLALQPPALQLVIGFRDSRSPAASLSAFTENIRLWAALFDPGLTVLVPESLSDTAELALLMYAPERYRPPPDAPIVGDGRAGRVSRTWVPFAGAPHPFSPGEQALARALAQDRALGGLFEFNQAVETVMGSRHIVDLLWKQGKFVVEIDGYRFHKEHVRFAADRQRDYELLVSGYKVVRLTHDEAVRDTPAALDKLRRVVQMERGA